MSGPYTVVAFHAHPDDESLLTGGTLAAAAADGHRVVLVVATCGERGLAGPEDGVGATLAAVRTRELHQAAAALGCARVVLLGYGDSGLRPDPQDRRAFAHVDIEAAADRLVEVLHQEHADVLIINDRNGGYGHPDHVQVHRVGTRAAAKAGTSVVLEATVPGRLFRAVLAGLRLAGDALGRSAPLPTRRVFADPGLITHRVRIWGSLPAKRSAMRAQTPRPAPPANPECSNDSCNCPARSSALRSVTSGSSNKLEPLARPRPTSSPHSAPTGPEPSERALAYRHRCRKSVSPRRTTKGPSGT